MIYLVFREGYSGDDSFCAAFSTRQKAENYAKAFDLRVDEYEVDCEDDKVPEGMKSWRAKIYMATGACTVYRQQTPPTAPMRFTSWRGECAGADLWARDETHAKELAKAAYAEWAEKERIQREAREREQQAARAAVVYDVVRQVGAALRGEGFVVTATPPPVAVKVEPAIVPENVRIAAEQENAMNARNARKP